MDRTGQAPGVVSVTELQRAWQAVRGGQFRRPAGETTRPSPRAGAPGRTSERPGTRWWSDAPLLPVLGCHGGAGASTLAAAVADRLTGPVRLVEACGAGGSGLVGYATAELGQTSTGWLRGHRDHVVIDRAAQAAADPTALPRPEPADDAAVHVLDPGWDLETLALSPGWLPEAVLGADRLVLVTTATVPGMRRLEGALSLVDPGRTRVVVAVRGPRSGRWPREVRHCPGRRSLAVLKEARVEVPDDPGLRVRGLDTTPLPGGVLAAAAQIVQLAELTAGTDNRKGTPHVRQ